MVIDNTQEGDTGSEKKRGDLTSGNESSKPINPKLPGSYPLLENDLIVVFSLYVPVFVQHVNDHGSSHIRFL